MWHHSSPASEVNEIEASGLCSLIGTQITERGSILKVSQVLWVLGQYQEGLCLWACAQTSRPPTFQATKCDDFCDVGGSGTTGPEGWICELRPTLNHALSSTIGIFSACYLGPAQAFAPRNKHMHTYMHTQIRFFFLSKPNSCFLHVSTSFSLRSSRLDASRMKGVSVFYLTTRRISFLFHKI